MFGITDPLHIAGLLTGAFLIKCLEVAGVIFLVRAYRRRKKRKMKDEEHPVTLQAETAADTEGIL